MLLADFEKIYRKIFNCINNPILNKEDLWQIIESDNAIAYNPNFFCIINSDDFSFEYISKNMYTCLGMTEIELKTDGLNSIWNRVHPQDINCLYASLDELHSVTNKLPHDNDGQYSYSWNYRIEKADGAFLNIIQNTTPFSLSETNAKMGLTHFTVIHAQHKMPIRASLNLLGKDGKLETKYTNNCTQNSFFKGISKREKDVIRLLAKEKSSKSIAKQLFISSNTVDTHRRNILKKLKLSSTGELINILKTQKYFF
jgi:DNA-binding CsgD family transcriptional regulator